MKYLIIPDSVFIGGRFIKNASVLTDGDRIADIFYNGRPETGAEIIPLPGLMLAPGFIDIHTHGCYGYDVMQGTEALAAVSAAMLRDGVTAYCPTLITAPLDDIKAALVCVKQAMENEPANGARIIGAFCEGPYINTDYRGAHNEDLIRDISIDEIMDLLSTGSVKSFAIAPEKEGAAEVIPRLREKNIDIRAGHCRSATGADIIIHTYNTMERLSHKQDNVLSQALTDDDLYTEFICDYIHTTRAAAVILYRCKGNERIILVTDSISAAGQPDGEYRLGSGVVQLINNRALTVDGRLAGSVLSMPRAVYNMSRICGLENALLMATRNPALALGVYNDLGSVEINKKPDLIGFEVNNGIDIKFVMKNGDIL